MNRTHGSPGLVALAAHLPKELDTLVPAPRQEPPSLKLPPTHQDLSEFGNLKDSPLAEHLRSQDPHYKVLCDAYQDLARDPTHFTLGMRRLRMMCIDGMSCEAIAKAQNPPIRTLTLWPQVSTAARDLLESVGLQGRAEDFARLTAQLKGGTFELNFQPWLVWFKQWREDPLGVALPPPVSGLISRDVFERLDLGESQQGKGVSGAERPGKSPDRRNREFTASPFIKDGFFGVEVRANPDSFSDCPSVMPRTRALVLGYHEDLTKPATMSRDYQPRLPALDPVPTHPQVAVKHLTILQGRRTPQGELLVASGGALECLRRGIGPFDLNLLQAYWVITSRDSGASIDCFPFSRGDRHFADSLRLPKERLQELGITHAKFTFEPSDLQALRCGGAMSFSVHGYKTPDDKERSYTLVALMGRVHTKEEHGRVRITFDPSPELIDPESKWYRTVILNPRLEALLNTGQGEIPLIGERKVNGSGDGGPRFHMLEKDFCLPVTFRAPSVFVRGEVVASSQPESREFRLTAFTNALQKDVVAQWTTPIGLVSSKRSWTKLPEPSTAPQAQSAPRTHTADPHRPSPD